MLKIVGKKIFTILHSKCFVFCFMLTNFVYLDQALKDCLITPRMLRAIGLKELIWTLTFDTRHGIFIELVAKPIGTVMADSTPRYSAICSSSSR